MGWRGVEEGSLVLSWCCVLDDLGAESVLEGRMKGDGEVVVMLYKWAALALFPFERESESERERESTASG